MTKVADPQQHVPGACAALASMGGGSAPIAVMDSGVGGLPYLGSIRALLPGERFVYLADRAGFPYGTKSRAEIERLVVSRIASLVDAFGPRAVVIACNTASQAALAAARVAFPGLPVIGTVPAVKPAAERSKSRVIGIMATSQAVKDPYLDSLVADHAAGVSVLREAAQDLVSFVERDFVGSDPSTRRRAIEPHVRPLLEGGADEIVLACTHFLHVAPDIEAFAAEWAMREAGGRRIEVVDSRDGVARRLRDLVHGTCGADAPGGGGQESSPDGVFILSGPPPFEARYADFARGYGLAGPFSLDPAGAAGTDSR